MGDNIPRRRRSFSVKALAEQNLPGDNASAAKVKERKETLRAWLHKRAPHIAVLDKFENDETGTRFFLTPNARKEEATMMMDELPKELGVTTGEAMVDLPDPVYHSKSVRQATIFVHFAAEAVTPPWYITFRRLLIAVIGLLFLFYFLYITW